MVIFDCDGLLVDTEPSWTVAETELFRRRGRGFGVAEKAMLIGRSLDDASAVLAEEFGERGCEGALIDELLVLVAGAVAAGARVMTGAQEIVDLAQGKLPVGVASNSPRALMDVALERGGFGATFQVRIAADGVAAPKPAPDMYLEACGRLGVHPADALAFEDSSTGLRSATAAGVRTVGIPTLANHALEADWVWPSLADADLVAWVKTW